MHKLSMKGKILLTLLQMNMECKLNSLGGGDSRLLFRDGGAELPGSFGAFHGARSSGEDELCEELEPEWELESTSMPADCLVEEALV